MNVDVIIGGMQLIFIAWNSILYLRRQCVNGDFDPKSTQAQLRHADPSITLKHYQKSIPATVKVAAMALEAKLGFHHSEQVLNRQKIQ